MATLIDMILEEAEENVLIKVAQKLLERGISITAISQDTGLSEEKIAQLQKDLKKIVSS